MALNFKIGDRVTANQTYVDTVLTALPQDHKLVRSIELLRLSTLDACSVLRMTPARATGSASLRSGLTPRRGSRSNSFSLTDFCRCAIVSLLLE